MAPTHPIADSAALQSQLHASLRYWRTARWILLATALALMAGSLYFEHLLSARIDAAVRRFAEPGAFQGVELLLVSRYTRLAALAHVTRWAGLLMVAITLVRWRTPLPVRLLLALAAEDPPRTASSRGENPAQPGVAADSLRSPLNALSLGRLWPEAMKCRL